MFPNNKTLSYPLCFIGIVMIVCGVRWLIHPEPWMLDEVANVERLGITFNELFEEEINATLPDYLRQIYRFFGFWVIIIGLFLIFFTTPQISKNKSLRNRVLIILGLMLLIGIFLGYSLIPSSHFINLIWLMILLYIISCYAHYKGIDNV